MNDHYSCSFSATYEREKLARSVHSPQPEVRDALVRMGVFGDRDHRGHFRLWRDRCGSRGNRQDSLLRFPGGFPDQPVYRPPGSRLTERREERPHPGLSSTPAAAKWSERGDPMIKGLALAALAATVLLAQEETADHRVQRAAETFTEIMSTPDKGIPNDLVKRAECVVIIPGVKKAAFVVGGEYGKGFAECRHGNGWSGPVAFTLGGGSFGFQIG